MSPNPLVLLRIPLRLSRFLAPCSTPSFIVVFRLVLTAVSPAVFPVLAKPLRYLPAGIKSSKAKAPRMPRSVLSNSRPVPQSLPDDAEYTSAPAKAKPATAPAGGQKILNTTRPTPNVISRHISILDFSSSIDTYSNALV